jgi:hypothetical protein
MENGNWKIEIRKQELVTGGHEPEEFRDSSFSWNGGRTPNSDKLTGP